MRLFLEQEAFSRFPFAWDHCIFLKNREKLSWIRTRAVPVRPICNPSLMFSAIARCRCSGCYDSYGRSVGQEETGAHTASSGNCRPHGYSGDLWRRNSAREFQGRIGVLGK